MCGRARVVIVGAGFAGLAAARALARADAEVTLVDRRNHHLFQPLLYQVATAALSPADIAWPIRGLVRGQRNVRVVMGRVCGIDTVRREVLLEGGARHRYDHLVLATGATHTYFGHDDWADFAPGLKTLDDATEIRRRVLLAFERAETCPEPARRAALQTFVVVGGGATGVEMAGAIAELARRTLACDFRRIDPAATRVVLVEAGPRLLPGFPERLSRAAARALVTLGVEVRTGQAVTGCGPDGIGLGAEAIAAATVIWAAGVAASPAGRWLGAESDRAGRVAVAPDLSVPGHPEILVLGDTAAVATEAGTPVPGIAPAAKQMGSYAGRLIAGRIAGRPAPPPFRYRHQGSLATVGRNAAVAELGRLHLAGFPAWLLWAVAHVYFLIGSRNRAVVALNWCWTYFTGARGARLITGGAPAEPAPPAEARRVA